MGQWGDAFTSLSLISREYNCFIVLLKNTKLSRKIQALSESDYSMSRADICFSFSPEACLRKWFLREEKKLAPSTQQKVLLGFRDEITNSTLTYTSDFSAVEGRLSAAERPPLAPSSGGTEDWEVGMSGLHGGLWQWVRRDEEFRERKTSC